MTSYEYQKGYREQSAWLRRQAPSIPSAEHCLNQRQATHDGSEYNLGGDQATTDYIARARQYVPGQPCPACGAVGSACQCGHEYV